MTHYSASNRLNAFVGCEFGGSRLWLNLFVFLNIFFVPAFSIPIMATDPLQVIEAGNGNSLKILTFNIWESGSHVEDGLHKIAKHIKAVNPDIVAIQEIQTSDDLAELLGLLGPGWTGIVPPYVYPRRDLAILSRHHIDLDSVTISPSNVAIGANIHFNNDSTNIISFWCLHLRASSYGPYAANFKMVTKLEQILSGDSPDTKDGRKDNMLEILNLEGFKKALANSETIPMIACGDFNTPSHLDWIEANKDIHGGWAVPWPATALLQDEGVGMKDSFRELYPDPVKYPGITWSTVNLAYSYPETFNYSIPEPLDRIDFIFYKSSTIKPAESYTYSGPEPLKPNPFQRNNDYPSDHYAVVTVFSF